MITEKENFYRMINKQEPEFISGAINLFQVIIPSACGDRAPGVGAGTGTDGFGVHWVSSNGAPAVPDPKQKPLLEDICDWREQVHFPDLDHADWEGWAKKDLEGRDPNKITMILLSSGPFERLHDLMGFQNALEATIMEPEECEAFFSAMCDFRIRQIEYLKKYYKPDLIQLQDDWGSQMDLLFSPDFWRTALKPHMKRVVDACHDMGILFNLHSCGKIDRIIDDIVELNVDMLDSMMVCNDCDHWMDAYGHSLIFMGGLDSQGVVDRPGVTPDEIHAEVESRIKRYASKGYYIPMPYGLGPTSAYTMAYAAYYGMTYYHPQEYKERAESFWKAMQELMQSGGAGNFIPTSES